MHDGDVTFGKILLPPERAGAVSRKFERTRPLRDVHAELEKHQALRSRGNLALVAGKIGDLLDVGIARNVLLKVWNDAQLFRRYLDRDRYPSNETIAVPLAEHTITSTHHPYLEVRFDASVIRRIDFELSLTVTLKGFIIEIQDARIKKIRTGTYSGKMELKCEGARLVSETLDSTDLPGEWEFKGGIPIAP